MDDNALAQSRVLFVKLKKECARSFTSTVTISLGQADRRLLLTSSSAVRLGRPLGTSPLEPGPDRKKQTLANVSSAH